jgi:hypothetical protein
VDNLKRENEATLKEDVSVYVDVNQVHFTTKQVMPLAEHYNNVVLMIN